MASNAGALCGGLASNVSMTFVPSRTRSETGGDRLHVGEAVGLGRRAAGFAFLGFMLWIVGILPGCNDTTGEVSEQKDITSVVLRIRQLGHTVDVEILTTKVTYDYSVSANPLTYDAELLELTRQLPGVVWLHLSGTKVRDHELAALQGMSNLRSLSLDDTSVTLSAESQINTLQGLRELYAARSLVADDGARSISQLADLDYLDLDDTLVGNVGLDWISRLSKVRTLYLARTKIDSQGIPSIWKLRTLTHLNLTGVQCDSGAMLAVTNCEKLRVLRLAYTQVDDRAMKTICKLPWLEALNLDGTRVTDESVALVQRMAAELRSLSIAETSMSEAKVSLVLPYLTVINDGVKAMLVRVLEEKARGEIDLPTLAHTLKYLLDRSSEDLGPDHQITLQIKSELAAITTPFIL